MDFGGPVGGAGFGACDNPGCEEAECGEEFDQEASENPCCEKDRKERAEGDRIRAVLTANCPVRRLEEQRAFLSNPQNILASSYDQDDHDSLDSLDDEDDAELLRWRAERMGAMEREVGAQKELKREGHGAYDELKEKDLKREVEHGADQLVVHFYVQGSEAAGTVDEMFDSLAYTFLSTRFVRVALARGSPWTAQLQITTLPAIVCFKKGAVTARSGGLAHMGGASNFDEDRCKRWLAKRGMLEGYDAVGIRSDEEEDDDDDEDNAPCATCGRTYKHEHIRAVYSANYPDAGQSDSDG